MNQISFVKGHYHLMKEQIPSRHRGYLYILNNGLSDDGDIYDIVLAHEIIAKSDGLIGDSTKKDLEALALLHLDSKIRPVPFYKFETLYHDAVNYSDMEEIHRRTGGIIFDFLLFDNSIGRMWKREIEEGIPCFNRYPIRSIPGSDLSHEERRILDEKKEFLKSNHFCLSCYDHTPM